MEIGDARRHERVLLASLAAQVEQAAVQRHAVTHVGRLSPLHSRPHALRPAVQAVGIAQQLWRGLGVAAGLRDRRRRSGLVGSCRRHKQLYCREVGQVVCRGWAPGAANRGNFAAQGAGPLVPTP